MIGYLAGFQALAETYMHTPVTIRRKTAPGEDPSDRTGDNTVTYEAGTTTVMGWFVDANTTYISRGRMSSITDRPMVRLPMGTLVDSGDQVTIGTTTWTCVDSSMDETWPIWLKATLIRIE